MRSATPAFYSFEAGVTGGIACRNLSWNADKVRSVEVRCRVREEGGYYQLNFTAVKDGRTYSSFCGWSAQPDGKWQTISFPVGDNAAWRGTITSLKFMWMAKSAVIDVASIQGRPFRNALYDLRPRAICRMSRLSGKAPAALEFLDRDYKTIGRVELPASAVSKDFTVPVQTMTHRLIPANAPVLVEQRELPHLDQPPAFWRGAWIWCQNGFGPDAAYVWFQKEFELEALPEEAQFVGVGDDAYTLFLNGKEIGGSSNWSKAKVFDVRSALKPGKNTMLIRVYNAQAWGGLLCELYAKVSGKARYVVSDGTFRFAHGTREKAGEFRNPAMVLGKPPVAPWNSRMSYCYVGPKGNVKLLSAGENVLTLQILEAPAVQKDTLTFRLVPEQGSARLVLGKITPATGAWKKGTVQKVRYTLPAQHRPARLELADPTIAVTGSPAAGSVQLRSAAAPQLATVRVENCGVRPWINVNGKRLAPIYYLLAGAFQVDPESRGWMIRNARMSGCEILRFGTAFHTFWTAPDRFDFRMLDRHLETVFYHAPEAKIILNLNTGMPDWWLAQYPDDATCYDGDRPRHQQHDRQALASKRYLKDAPKGIRALIRYLKSSPYADRVIGIAISEGWNSEWFWSYQDNNNRTAMAGYSPADQATFRSYLKERYRTDGALQKAWNMPGITLENAPMPGEKAVERASAGSLMDPEKDMQIIDWFRFRNRSIAEAIESLCKVVKDETDGKWLAGAYYGYFLAFSNIFRRLQSVGHLNIRQIAASPYVDFLTAPSFYTWRYSGQGDAVMQPPETFTMRNKLIIVEQDLRTFPETSGFEIHNGMLCTPEQSVGAVERCVALTMTRGVGTHWFEMYENWFREPLLIDVMRAGKKAYESLPPVRGLTPAECALVIDPESAMYTRHNDSDNMHTASVGEMRRRLNEAGAPFRFITVDDLLEKGAVPPQKFYIMANAVMLPPEKGRALLARFAREKATVLWLYAAGVSTPEKGPSAEAMTRLLGMKFRTASGRAVPEMQLKDGYSVRKARNFVASSPWFYPVSGYDEVIGTTPAGDAALVRKNINGATHYFSSLMNLPMPLVRDLEKRAGVFHYSGSDDPVLIGNDVIALHAKSGGPKQLFLPAGCTLRPILGPVRKSVRSGERFFLPTGRTAVFAVEKK